MIYKDPRDNRVFLTATIASFVGSFLIVFAVLSSSAATTLKDGDIVKTATNPDVYIIKLMGTKKFRRLILSPSVFNSYGHLKWYNIKTISESDMNNYTVSDLVRAVEDAKVYRLFSSGDTGTRRWVNLTASEFNSFGYDWDAIYTINTIDRDSYNTSTDITYGPDTTTTTTLGTTSTIFGAYTLNVVKNGSGSGTVNGTGISCGNDCIENFSSGNYITLFATPNSNSTFIGWTGVCAGTSSCTILMNSHQTITATFNLSGSLTTTSLTSTSSFTLSISKSGSGSGAVVSSPSGISCGATCSYSFNSGTSVTLTASASSGSIFSGWSGSCSGSGSCVVSLTAAKSATATFNTSGPVSVECSASNVLCVDDSSGSNQEYSTIQAAVNAAVAGNTVMVYGGTYNEMVKTNKSGTASSPITIKAASGESPIVSGSNTRQNAFQSSYTDYITIDGFTIKDVTGAGIQIYRSDNNTVKNNTFTGYALRGINVLTSNDALIENNYINNTAISGKSLSPGIDGSAAVRAIIKNNKIIGAYSFGIDLSSASDSVVIERNYIQKAASSNENGGLELRGSQHGIIRNNVIEMLTGSYGAITVRTTDSVKYPCTDITVINNTFHAELSGMAFNSCSGTVKNNIFYRSTAPTTSTQTGAQCSNNVGTVNFDNNLLYNFYSSQIIVNKTTNCFTIGSNNITGQNPKLSASGSKPNPYYSLQSTSPAKNAGDNSVGSDAGSSDHAGNSRFSGTIDIGAFEQ